MLERDLLKYLRKNPVVFPEGLALYRHAVVIPAYDENDYLPQVLDLLDQAETPCPTAVIVVVNHPAGKSDKSSLELLNILASRKNPVIFPLYAPELSGGVGAARKLGMDCFIHSRTAENVDSSVIFSLDADSKVSLNYFSESLDVLHKNPEAPGVLIKIRHQHSDDPAQESAVRKYEDYLFRYAQKLAKAGSPYGFVSIGSGFAVRCRSYIKAGGMRVKTAGEDFYFLQELAKQGTLCRTENELVFPSARVSERVPFGTGQAVKSLMSGKGLNEIPDRAFACLAEVISAAKSRVGFLNTPDPGEIPGDVSGFFRKEKFYTAWQMIYANTPNDHDARIKAFFRWFDGLKTLRFLHSVQNMKS